VLESTNGRHRPELSVVVSTLGNYSGLERVLDRLAEQDAPAWEL